MTYPRKGALALESNLIPYINLHFLVPMVGIGACHGIVILITLVGLIIMATTGKYDTIMRVEYEDKKPVTNITGLQGRKKTFGDIDVLEY